ncbi:TetR/AcrR family transcriptional regulator [Clostridium hydrogenum]|uniref:TetR/AcrR family transcriptional regulator n=1 Tax=Clostridium hydrogenum TaxID=2855764 RepID=UPI002E336489|nr:TetR family transcriptional regulator [Clostridium hydrogenum]
MIGNTLETREMLLDSAKKEFLKKGFEKASLRTICKNAGLTTGALYFFFNNKEDVFDCLVKDIVVELKSMLCNFSQKEKLEYKSALNNERDNNFQLDIEDEKEVMKYLYTNKEEFVLLINKAQGSPYENYYHEIVGFLEQLFDEFFQLYYDKEIVDSKTVQYAIHNMVSWKINSYIEILKNSLTLEEAMIQAEIIAKYAIGGFQNVIKSIT